MAGPRPQLENLLAVMKELNSKANPANVAGMARYGINPKGTLGISIYKLRRMAKRIGTSHILAIGLWKTGVHEARILASMVDEPAEVTEGQMEEWVKNFDSWDVCDQVCSNLFDKTSRAYAKAVEWSGRREEFVKRAGFAIMAALAVQDKTAEDEDLAAFLPIIIRESDDERNFVKKAVNWALRNIGKRNLRLNKEAIKTAKTIGKIQSKTARWIASDALRELNSEEKQERLRKKDRK
jgi:3-methyladenine DNA glycosylase AlkD